MLGSFHTVLKNTGNYSIIAIKPNWQTVT